MAPNTATALVLLAISFLLAVLLIRNIRVNRLFSFSLLMTFGIWYACPLLISVFNWNIFGSLQIQNTVSYDTYIKYAIWDLLYFDLSILGFVLWTFFSKPGPPRIFTGQFQNQEPFLKLCWYGSALVLVLAMLLPRSDYMTRNLLTTDPGIRKFLDFLSFYAISVFIFFMVFIRQRLGRFFHYGAHILFVIYSLYVTTGGARIFLLGPILIYGYLVFFAPGSKKKPLLAVFLIGLMMLSLVLVVAVERTRKEGAFDVKDVLAAVKETDISSGSLVYQFGRKLNSVFYGAILCEYDGIGAAGLNPYINSLFVAVPRFVFPNKPVPMSKNGTIYGHPIRLAADYMIPKAERLNVGIKPSQIALWHGGFLGYSLNVLFTIFFLSFTNRLIQSNLSFAKIIAILFLNFPYLEMMITFDEFILKFVRIVVIYVSLYVLFITINSVVIHPFKKARLGSAVYD